MAKVSYNKLKCYDNDMKTTVIADKYDSTKTYQVNDYCVYSSVDNTTNGGSLYRCTTAITTAEAWTAAHWTQVNIGDDLGPLSRRIDALTNETKSLTGNPVELTDGVEGAPLKSCVLNIRPMQWGNGDASPNNIRTIYGWAEGNLSNDNSFSYSSASPNTRTGGVPNSSINGNTLTNTVADGSRDYFSFVVKKSIMNTPYASYNEEIRSAGYYSLAFTINESLSSLYIAHNGTQYDIGCTFAFSKALTPGTYMLGIYVSKANPSIVGGLEFTILSLAPAQVHVQFGDTIYGGNLNILTGLLYVTHKLITANDYTYYDSNTSAGGLHWVQGASTGLDYSVVSQCLVSSLPKITNGAGGGWASTTEVIDARDNQGGQSLRIYTTATSLQNFKDTHTDLQIVAKLATPIEIQLTPQEVTLLAGSNTIWADCGDVSIEYGGYIGSIQDEIERLNANTNISTSIVPSPISPFHILDGDDRTRLVRLGKIRFLQVSVYAGINDITFNTITNIFNLSDADAPAHNVMVAGYGYNDSMVYFAARATEKKITVTIPNAAAGQTDVWVWGTIVWIAGE